MKRTRHIIPLAVTGLFLAAAFICGVLLRRTTAGVAEPDTQEMTVVEIASTVSERIAALGDTVSDTAVRNAVADQLSLLGTRGFIRVRIAQKNVDVLAGTDYGLERVDVPSADAFWSSRMSLSPVGAPDTVQPLYFFAWSTRTGNVWTAIMIGSAGPTTAQARAILSFTTAMWASLCCAAACGVIALLPNGVLPRRADPFWTPARRGIAVALVGVIIALPVTWAILHRTQTAARAEFARGADLVAATSAMNLADVSLPIARSAAWLHASYSMYYNGASFHVFVDGTLATGTGTDYGAGAFVTPGAAGAWRVLTPADSDLPRSVYVTSATRGAIRVELAVAEPQYWQVIRLRTILLCVLPIALGMLFALGWLLGNHPRPAVPTTEEVLRRAVVRQTVFTALVVCLALLPAAAWFLEAVESVSLARLDQAIERDAAGFQKTLATLEPSTVASTAAALADTLDITRTGLIFSLQASDEQTPVSISLNPQYATLTTAIGAAQPQGRVVPNRTDPSLPTGSPLRVRVMTFSGQLKDGTLYTALLGTSLQSVRQDMQELWKSAAWAGPVAFAFLLLASLATSLLASRPVTDAMRRLEQFTGDAAHELRTPLASMRLNTQVALAQDQQPEEFRRHLAAVLSQTERSTRLAESLVLLARLDRQTEPSMEQVDLSDVWRELGTDFAEQLAAKELALQTPTAPLVVTANRDLLTLALDNLLDNAVRYSPAGGTIIVSTEQVKGEVSIAVSDQGPGIPPEALPRIWDRFYRVDASRSRESGGTGLGLAITRKATEAMHGRVAVTSEVGRGSTFRVILTDTTIPRRG